MLPWLAHCASHFCLGRPRRLSLRACRFSFLRFQFVKDRIVLGDVSWQLGLSLFILRRFFLLSMGLGPCMKWVGAAEFFDPTVIIKIHLTTTINMFIILRKNISNEPIILLLVRTIDKFVIRKPFRS